MKGREVTLGMGGGGMGSEAPGRSGVLFERSTPRESRQGHTVQGRECEDTGHREGRRGGLRLLGTIFQVALTVRLALFLSLQVIRAQLLLLFPPHALDHHQHQDDHSQEAPH